MKEQPSEKALHLLFDHQIYWAGEGELISDPGGEITATDETLSTDTTKQDSSPGEIEKIAEEEPTETIPFLGDNLKKIWMIFTGGPVSQMPRDQKVTFVNLLKSIQLEFKDVACTGIQEFNTRNWSVLRKSLDFDHLFLWGIDPAEFDLTLEPFSSKKEGDVQVTSLSDFKELHENTEIKRKVWNCIRDLQF